MKTKKVFWAVLITLFSCNLFAEGYPTGSLLWKISGKDLKEPSYILGTMHLKSGAFLDSIPGALQALSDSRQVIGEVDLLDLESMKQQMMSVMLMPEDTTYNMLYSEQEYDLVDKKIALALGAGLDKAGMLIPSALLQAIVMKAYREIIPYLDVNEILDIYIQQEAYKSEKKIIGLETSADQIQMLFQSQSLQQQADMLLCFLTQEKEVVAYEMNKLIENYNKAELNILFDNEEDELELCGINNMDYEYILIKDRNDKWIQKLPDLMNETPSFIAVGAGHLSGESGILTQLIRLGYHVDPVNNRQSD